MTKHKIKKIDKMLLGWHLGETYRISKSDLEHKITEHLGPVYATQYNRGTTTYFIGTHPFMTWFNQNELATLLDNDFTQRCRALLSLTIPIRLVIRVAHLTELLDVYNVDEILFGRWLLIKDVHHDNQTIEREREAVR